MPATVQSNRQTYTVTITVATDAKLSSPAFLDGRTLAALVLPAQWTSSDLTFQVSLDGDTFFDLYIGATGQYTVAAAQAVAGAAIALDVDVLRGWDYVIVRSATDQTADRTITLLAI